MMVAAGAGHDKQELSGRGLCLVVDVAGSMTKIIVVAAEIFSSTADRADDGHDNGDNKIM